jgi:RND family efflux transporter MFP subunit
MRTLIVVLVAVAAALGGLYALGVRPDDALRHVPGLAANEPAAAPTAEAPRPPLVTVARVEPADFQDMVLVTGTLVPREEILVSPEIDGLRILELKADEGDRVKAGQVLATMVQETLDAQIAQSDASLAKATAAISQSRSQIAEAEARLKEARAAFERAKPLLKDGHISESVYDQRESAARTAEALLVAAQDGLKVAEADKSQIEAQRRETTFRFKRAEITAPANGLISRRTARIGAMALGSAEPMFRIIENGDIELDADVPETELSKIKLGQHAKIHVAGIPPVDATVRLISPEVDRATRLGRVRLLIGDKPGLYIGAFGRGEIETARSRGLAVPSSAVMYGPDGPYVQIVEGDVVVRRSVTLGLQTGVLTEVTQGLSADDLVVAKSGTFLREGDRVRPASPGKTVSEAAP